MSHFNTENFQDERILQLVFFKIKHFFFQKIYEVLVVVFWVVAPCSDAVGYQRFGGHWSLHLQSEMSKVLRNVNILPQY